MATPIDVKKKSGMVVNQLRSFIDKEQAELKDLVTKGIMIQETKVLPLAAMLKSLLTENYPPGTILMDSDYCVRFIILEDEKFRVTYADGKTVVWLFGPTTLAEQIIQVLG